MSVSWNSVRTWSVECAGSVDRDMEVSQTLSKVNLPVFIADMQFNVCNCLQVVCLFQELLE